MAATSASLGFRFFGYTVTPTTGTFTITDFDEQMGWPITIPLTGGKQANGRIIGVKVAPNGTSAEIYVMTAALAVVGMPPSGVTEYPTNPTIG